MLYLRKARPSDIPALKELYQRSRAMHEPWAYAPSDYQLYVSDERHLLCFEHSHEIVASFHISGIVWGQFQSGYLSYEVFSPYQGKGYMRQGMKFILQYAFATLNLHRLEANIQPANEASLRLVEGAGFKREGFSEAYLNIGGRGWKDHERWALINSRWQIPASK